ncbi:hypothetical protein K439DRAFT_1613327 [Ramaria rubella]|nr:hypothetical protein K439DRAFT_1613327 [Ramaria rubella]
MGKKKKPTKKPVNPYLSSNSNDDNGGASDGKDLQIKHTDSYNQNAMLLKSRWSCKQHEGVVCLGDKMKHKHFVASCVGELAWVLGLINCTNGIDLESPPHMKYFRDWYFKPSSMTRWAGAKKVEDQIQPTTTRGTRVTVNMPPEAFQQNHQLPTHDQQQRHSQSSGSVHSASPVQSPDTPDVGMWLTDLQVLADVPAINWNKLTLKFEGEDYLAMPLHSLAAFTSDLMCAGFGLTMQELSVVTEQLKKAAKQYTFVMRTDTGKSHGN